MKFSEFIELSETMTDTSCIAGFSRRVGEVITRGCPKGIQEPEGKKKKPYQQPQVKESFEDICQGDPRFGCACPHCGSNETCGARSMEKGENGRWAYANAACQSCKNGFGFNFETNTAEKILS